ncbi:2-C-methyl-D-erythritol 4-phosphate cytidylyltransferase [Lachnospiraceae bacterium XBB2008]|nr:2-C-methyl-D-erythritol 4-phosphate cytidylyltransferase [Lachnospiraceae bacterium XBB2008]
MNIALLTAAGKSTRMHMDIPKQFMNIGGKPVIAHTMEAFEHHPEIDWICVVTLETRIDTIKAYARKYAITKLRWVVTGGETGQESIECGIKQLQKDCQADDVIMVHDGNRPFISEEIITDSLATYREYGSAVAAIPCIEAIFRSGDGISSIDQIPREELYRTQTPHTYSLQKMLWAHEQAKLKDITNTTATCTLMQLLGETIFFSKGSEKNLKLTTQEDIEIFKAILKVQNDEDS